MTAKALTAAQEADLVAIAVADVFKARPRTTADLAAMFDCSASTIERALRANRDEIVRRQDALRREVHDRDRTEPLSADALAALPPWIAERHAPI